MYRAILLVCFAAAVMYGQQSPDSQAAYSQAATDWNAGRIPQAKEKLAALLERDPNYFRGYRLLWDAVARCDGEAQRDRAVEQALARFAKVPTEQRTEDFYYALSGGLKLLKRDEEAGRITQEAISRYPRRLMAQSAMLDGARKELDARRAAQLYQDYMRSFPENISWCEIASRDRFLLMAGHQDQFSKEALVEAAAQWESGERAFTREFGPDARYLNAGREIARVLLDKDPALSFSYASKAAAFVAQEWANTTGLDPGDQFTLWPLMLEAAVQSNKWPTAERLGRAAVREIEAGKLQPRLNDLAGEVKVRRLYAEALDHAGKPEEARREHELARALLDEHSPPAIAARERRANRVKTELLASEANRPAAPFRLLDLEGRPESLADYRGKTLIVAFWATWCMPCRKELEELNRLADRFRDNPRAALLTISVDDTTSVAAEFASKYGYRFPILKSDGKVESAYTKTTIPQLYIIDPAGVIRFQVTGFEEDGLFERKLEWMIEVASGPRSVPLR